MNKKSKAIYGQMTNGHKIPLRMAILRTKKRIEKCHKEFSYSKEVHDIVVRLYENMLVKLEYWLDMAIKINENIVYMDIESVPPYLSDLEVK